MLSTINEFAKIRKIARAYFCYILNKNIPNKLPEISKEDLQKHLQILVKENSYIDIAYIIDPSGHQVYDTISTKKEWRVGDGESRIDKGYFYRAIKDNRCIMTDPYPSVLTKDLCVSASMPIMDDKGNVLYVIGIDLSLQAVINIVHREKGDSLFLKFNQIIYSIFGLALMFVASVLFIHGIMEFIHIDFSKKMNINSLFESTILLTLSLAIFDLVKTIIQEEVIGSDDPNSNQLYIHKTMIRFLGSIIIALAIEGLMLVFKFSMTDPDKLQYSAYLLGGVAVLVVSLAYYINTTNILKKS